MVDKWNFPVLDAVTGWRFFSIFTKKNFTNMWCNVSENVSFMYLINVQISVWGLRFVQDLRSQRTSQNVFRRSASPLCLMFQLSVTKLHIGKRGREFSKVVLTPCWLFWAILRAENFFNIWRFCGTIYCFSTFYCVNHLSNGLQNGESKKKQDWQINFSSVIHRDNDFYYFYFFDQAFGRDLMCYF